MITVCIPCFAPRFDDLVECIETMNGPGLEFVVVTNRPQPIYWDQMHDAFGSQIRWRLINTMSEEINLSKWWNVGLLHAVRQRSKSFMVTESDVRMTNLNVKILQQALWKYDFSMVGPNLYGLLDDEEIHSEVTQSSWGHRSASHRICQTWMVKTATCLPADERFVWWHADEQHEMRHRALANGTAIVGASRYERPLHQDTDPDADPQRKQGVIDARRIFKEEWGFPTLVG